MNCVPFRIFNVKVPDQNHHVYCFLAGSGVSWDESVPTREKWDIWPWDSAIPEGTASPEFGLHFIHSLVLWHSQVCGTSKSQFRPMVILCDYQNPWEKIKVESILYWIQPSFHKSVLLVRLFNLECPCPPLVKLNHSRPLLIRFRISVKSYYRIRWYL